jgi:hypothetical protein
MISGNAVRVIERVIINTVLKTPKKLMAAPLPLSQLVLNKTTVQNAHAIIPYTPTSA